MQSYWCFGHCYYVLQQYAVCPSSNTRRVTQHVNYEKEFLEHLPRAERCNPRHRLREDESLREPAPHMRAACNIPDVYITFHVRFLPGVT